jgi:hypothetical protein
LVWFSCGVTSAVAAKLALQKYAGAAFDVHVCYCDTGSEHGDNARFFRDVQSWLGVEIKVLRSEKYKNVDEVIEGERFIVGPNGAPCTKFLKRLPRIAYQDPDDIHVFGFDTEDQAKGRVKDWGKNNPELSCDYPLLHHSLSKGECLTLCRSVGIEPPITYAMGYKHANCIGCVKGGMGYWNKVRVDFPQVFATRAKQERDLNHAILKDDDGPVFLDELDPKRGRYEDEPEIACGLFCGEVLKRLGRKTSQ